MKSFKDNAGRTWTLAVTTDAIKRVRALLDIDLMEAISGNLVDRLIQDPILLCDVVYAVCKPEADALGVSDEEFGRAMAGDAIEHATKALLEDLADFFPDPRDRENFRRVLAIAWRVMEKARDYIETRLESGELERTVEQELARLGNSSINAPASSDSTPGI